MLLEPFGLEEVDCSMLTFLVREVGIDVSQRRPQPTLVHEGQQSHACTKRRGPVSVGVQPQTGSAQLSLTLPGVFLPVEVDGEVFGVEINDGRILRRVSKTHN